MSPAMLFYPVLVQVLLTYVLLLAMARARKSHFMQAKLKLAEVSLRQNVYPPEVRKIENCFHNQLEMPILFYAVTLFAIALNKVDMPLVVLAWAFAGSRIAHAIIHTGSNFVPRRRGVFALGALTIFAMWGWLAIKVAA